MDYRERIDAKVGMLFQIADQYVTGQISLEQAKESVGLEMVHIRPAQIEAMKIELGERLKKEDQTKSEKLFELFQPYLSPPFHKLQDGHPLKIYFEENSRVRSYLLTIDQMEGESVAQEDWQEIYDLLGAFRVHIERQTKNFYPRLIALGLRLQTEKAKELGTAILDEIEKNRVRLEKGDLLDFLYNQRSLSQSLMNYIDLEERVLFGKALAGFAPQEFAELRKLDDQEGYAYIEPSAEFVPREKTSTGMATQGSNLEAQTGSKEAQTGSEEAQSPANLKNPDTSQELILPALLSAKEMGVIFYSPSGTVVSMLGEPIKAQDQALPEEIRRSLVDGTEKLKKFFAKKRNQMLLITYSLVRDQLGTLQGILMTRENLGEIPTENRKIDSSQNIVELFKMYPKFQEDFYEMDEDLKGLRGPYGMEILKETSVGMLAKSLRMETDALVDQINQLLESY